MDCVPPSSSIPPTKDNMFYPDNSQCEASLTGFELPLGADDETQPAMQLMQLNQPPYLVLDDIAVFQENPPGISVGSGILGMLPALDAEFDFLNDSLTPSSQIHKSFLSYQPPDPNVGKSGEDPAVPSFRFRGSVLVPSVLSSSNHSDNLFQSNQRLP